MTLKIRLVATIFAVSLLFPSSLLNGQTRFESVPTGGTDARASAEPPFPRSYELASGNVLLYTPQIASWTEQKRAVAWAAVSYKPTNAQKAEMGVIKVEADTQVSTEQRMVDLSPVRITEINFPTLPRERSQALLTELQNALARGNRMISLDRVLAAIDKSIIVPGKESNGLKADPPKIYHSATPAILIGFDGEPIWSPIKDTDLKFVVNTNWDLFEHVPTKTYYLRNDATWLKTTDIKGRWSPTNTLPPSFGKLPDDANWTAVKQNLPGKVLGRSAMPEIFVSFEPAELIVTKGQPSYTLVKGTSLLWVSNTESDLFRNGATGSYFYLVAGRWFSAVSLAGPWMFATPNLPADFRKIPVEHPRSRVLASVPGTDQAVEAVILASVPQTARINKNEVRAPEVIYQGQPDFQPIETTTLFRAVNTDKDVIRHENTYYLCYQGVWFVGTSPTGPWDIAQSVPDEIYKIPPSSPAYHVTFVKILADDNAGDEWISLESEAGYTGMMVGWGCAVWGSGWYYPPYYWYGGFYPWYIWYPRTFGFAAWYNPFTGTFGRGAAVYGPFGGAGAFAAYNPRTGTYARGGAVYGAYGARGFVQAWNPRTGTYAQTRQGGNIYGNWGSSYVRRGDDWARTAHVTNRVTGTRTTGIRTDSGGVITRKTNDGRTTVGRTEGGDVYAGRDGNVYRRQDGQWQKWENGSWNSAATPKQTDRSDKSTREQLDSDRSKRSEGNRRTRESNSYNPSRGGRNYSGSFRGSFGGGGFRGGGRRR